MPRYKILPTDQAGVPAVVDAMSPAAALQMLEQMDCEEADVLEDGRYLVSARKGPAGAWAILHRERTAADYQQGHGGDRSESKPALTSAPRLASSLQTKPPAEAGGEVIGY